MAEEARRSGRGRRADRQLETDKVSVEVPSPVAGVLTEQLVKEGDTVAVGAVIARIDETRRGRGGSRSSEPLRRDDKPAGAGETPALRGDEPRPVARRRADARSGHDLVAGGAPRGARRSRRSDAASSGTGKDGRLTKDDVIAAAQARKASPRRRPGPRRRRRKRRLPQQRLRLRRPRPPPGTRRTQEERVKMTRLRQTVAGASRKRRTPRPC